MNARSIIQKFQRQTDVAIFLVGCAKGFLRGIPVLIYGFSLFAAVDSMLQMPVFGRQLMWVLVVSGGGLVILSGFYPLRAFSCKEKSAQLRLRLIETGTSCVRVDDFCLAMDFLHGRISPGCSSEIAALFLNGYADTIRKMKASWAIPAWNWRRPLFVFMISVTVSVSLWAFFPHLFLPGARTSFPFLGSQIDKNILVQPGNSEVEWGGDVRIVVELRERSFDSPQLLINIDNEWTNVPSVQSGRVNTYHLKNIVHPIQYRVKWKNELSRMYVLTPLKSLDISEFRVAIRSPEYLGAKVFRQTSPEISGIIGSAVSIEAVVSEPVKSGQMIFTNGHEIELVPLGRQRLSVDFVISDDVDYTFSFDGERGERRIPRHYQIHATKDRSPHITLISPESDLLVGQGEKLPLIFQAEDDFGLGTLCLQYQINGGEVRHKVAANYDVGVDNLMGSYDWWLGHSDLKSGDVVRYRLMIEDRNSVSGPGKGYSDWRIVEISSFEKTHQDIEEILGGWRDIAMETLAELNVISEKIKSEGPDMPSLVSSYDGLARRSQNMERSLGEIVKMMEKDPLADYRVWLEHKAIQENLHRMNATTLRSLQSSMLTRNHQEASGNLRKMAADLERMLALSEELSREQKTKDVVSIGQDLEELGNEMVQRAEELSRASLESRPEIVNQIMDALKRASEMLKSLSDAINKMPEDLPEDFVNHEAMKNLEMQQSHGLIERLNEAMKTGDYAEALKLAQAFLSAMEKMSRQISKAGDSYSSSVSSGKLSKDLRAIQDQLGAIMEDERRLLTETQSMESKRLAAEMAEQENMLEKLAEKQENVVKRAKATALRRDMASNDAGVLRAQIAPMELVAAEMRMKRLNKGLPALVGVANQLDGLVMSVEKSTFSKSCAVDVRWLRDEEREILRQLQAPRGTRQFFSEEDQRIMAALSERQSQIRRDTHELLKNARMLSRRSAQMGSFAADSMETALTEMEHAGNRLNESDSLNAQRAEERALNALQNGQDLLAEIQGSFEKIAGEGGAGSGGGGKAVIRGGSSGQFGTRTDRVKIPTLKDYRPPKAFREELLEGLAEKYPQNYERVIQQYFKRLSQ